MGAHREGVSGADEGASRGGAGGLIKRAARPPAFYCAPGMGIDLEVEVLS
jgi:hypothetical protein